jgi:hypothetical protein
LFWLEHETKIGNDGTHEGMAGAESEASVAENVFGLDGIGSTVFVM